MTIVVISADTGNVLAPTVTIYDGSSSRVLSTTFNASGIVRTTTYHYDAHGDQIGMTQNGITSLQTTTYETISNELWRVTEKVTEEGSAYNFFEAFGRVFYTERTDPASTTRLSSTWTGYNDFGDVIEKDVFHATGNNVYSEFFEYDAFGNRLATTDALGLVETARHDALEVTLGTALNNPDSDGDGLLDGWEVANNLTPLSDVGDDGASADIDGDGLTNLQEQSHGGNPRSADTDGDGLSDTREVQFGTSLSLADTDHDGLSDGLEASLNLNALQPDSDGDGMNDGWEYQHRNTGFDPAVDNATDSNPDNDIDADPDGDGLSNGQECEWGTNPASADTDGDGVNDGTEIGQNSDPADPCDEGKPNTRIPVPFYFGDPSGSHSEKYRLEVTPISGTGETPATLSWLNENYGVCETKTAMLKAGWKYEVRLYHAGTNGSGSGYPDYDYELDCTSSSLPSNVVVEDPSSLFGEDYTSDSFVGDGKVATITVFAITGVAICKPDDSSWTELEESRVVLDDEELRIKIEISPQVKSLIQCRQAFGDTLTVKTSGTCPTGASVPIGDDATLVNSSGKSEIRIAKTRQQLITLGLLPSKNEDGVNEMAWVDVPETPGQDLSDSTAFSSLGYAFRGKAIVASNPNLETTPPISQRSSSFLKAAGCEIVSATYGDVDSLKRQIMNQADYFYFSGHGSHATGTIQGGVTPSMASQYWNRDLDCVLIAGCAVLDINDYNGNYGGTAEHNRSPGKLWANMEGPHSFLGYAFTAPLDAQGADRIARSWIANRGGMGDAAAWMKANDNRNGRNACAIERIDASNVRYSYFKREKGFLFNSYFLTNVTERIAQ